MTIRLGLTRAVFVLAGASAALAFQAGKSSPAKSADEAARLEREARNVTIVRDDWGIAHVHGKTDAEAVFGMIYAQAEDDFFRIESNYITTLGRQAEADGEGRLYQDLRMRLFVDPETLKKQYAESPAWLQSLMNAWADGLNFYLAKHPDAKARVIQRFEPWMALSLTEGSVPLGGDVDKVNLNQLQAFYGKSPVEAPIQQDEAPVEPGGSNGMAVAPSNTTAHHALMLINPHTSFFFRSELQMSSDEGLNAYGAATWGQFFLYQGFNEHAGWMHTSSGVDAVDEYLETVSKKGNGYVYKYGNEERPVTATEITLSYKTDSGMAQRKFTVYRTHHGPVVREMSGKWVAIRMMQEPIKALEQSYLRTKAKDYKSYLKTMDLQANSSNNTIFADSDGDIAYFHGNFIPRRDTKFDWTHPVDGSNPETEWHGLHSVAETPHLLNPKSGWIYNSNDWPWAAAGPDSPKRENYPAYVESGGPSARGQHAVRVLENRKDFTLDLLLAAAYDSYLTWFEKPMPALIKAWDATPESNPLKAKTAAQIALLRKWDLRWAADSVPTSLAVFWGDEVRRRVGGGRQGRRVAGECDRERARRPTPAGAGRGVGQADGGFRKLENSVGRDQSLPANHGRSAAALQRCRAEHAGSFTAATWGSLASFAARAYPGTKKWYGTSGNSFVAVVEFGPTVRARAVTAGGESGHVGTPHFNDEAIRYGTGNLREVYFYPSQLKGHTEREYHPGN